MTLRRILTVAVWLFATLVLAGAATLVWSSTELRRKNDALLRDFETVRSANEVALDLFRYRYHARQWLQDHKPEDYAEREESRDTLATAVRSLVRHTERTAQAAPVAAVDHNIEQYLLQLEVAHERFGNDVNAIFRVADPYFQRTLDALDGVVAVASRAAARSQEGAAHLDSDMNVAGAALSGLGLLLGVVLVHLLFRQLYSPVIALRDTMQRYRDGDRSARCGVVRPAEFAAIAGSINALIDQVESQRTSQLQFLAAIAHDLRNPLTSMKLYSRVIRPDHPMPDEGRLRRALEVISRQIDNLQRMTSDFLDAARIEAGELSMQLDPVDLVQIARDALQLFENDSADHTLQLEAPGTLEVLGDATRLHQVVVNLVSNAVKYSPQGSTVLIRIGRSEREASLSIQDQGVGIDAAELEHVFEPFRRGAGLKDQVPGVGLGLSITRRIVVRHGGRIDVSSAVGEGSTFTVRLPLPGSNASNPAGEYAIRPISRRELLPE